MTDGNLEWLMNWYVRECNNDWEHSYGVKIETLDNPGWTIAIDLRETFLEGRCFKSKHGQIAQDLDEWRDLGSWWDIKADGNSFEGACGPMDLSSVIGILRKWVVSHSF